MDNIEDKSFYGSIHTHIESEKDSSNASFNEYGKISFDKALNEFNKLGAKKIAITEHGAFNSFEDIYKASMNYPDLDVIPGCEVYLEYKKEYINKTPSEDRSHLILIAKDNEGYQSLCKIITESNKHCQIGKTKTYPIVTIENLQKNLAKGHIIATSACIAGPICRPIMSDLSFIEDKLKGIEKKLKKTEYFEIKQRQQEFNKITEEITKDLPSKEEIKEIKASKNKEEKKRIIDLQVSIKEKLNSPEYIELKNQITQDDKYISKNKLRKTINNYETVLEEYNDIRTNIINHNNLKQALSIYKELYSLFGNDFYFELQNHHLKSEEDTYNLLVRFAIQVGHPQFIASNDIHICMHKSNPEFQAEVNKRKVAKFLALKRYEEEGIDEYEYGIKTDKELREELLSIIKPYRNWTSEQIVDNAITNIKVALEKCKPYEVNKSDHYPKYIGEKEFKDYTDNQILEIFIKTGLKEKFPNGYPEGKEKEYEERLKKEIQIIESMGYSSYHLIVRDYLEYGRLLSYLPEKEIENAPLSIEELEKIINEKGYKRLGYGIGPGRGSAAGSLVCYLLGITDIDPIKYNLLFERFLNPERKSMPDIDSDFSPDIRDKCFEYCAKKYGESNICRIMTKTYQNAKGAIRLAGRYLGAKDFYNYITTKDIDIEDNYDIDIDENENNNKIQNKFTKKWYKVSDDLCKKLDERKKDLLKAELEAKGKTKEDIEKEIALLDEKNKTEESENLYIDDGELEEEIIDDGSINSLLLETNLTKNEKECIKLATEINGIYSADGEHACGLIISKDNIDNIIPLKYNAKKDNFSTQCTMAQAEDKGLLKMDFLGLKNLLIITNVLKETNDYKLQDYSIRDSILNDPNIYKNIYCSGRTLGIFQFESPGMTKMLQELQPDCFEDIIAAISLYRPGPMDFIPQYIEGKKHPEKVIYKCDALKEILSPTYGTIVYQEQVMQIFQAVGYTLGGADAIRKAMGKKHEEEIEAERNNFIYGNEERYINGAIKTFGMTENEATELFDIMKKFGRYAFNKSHATAYAEVSLFTAYEKEYHPAEFYKETLKYLSTQKRKTQMSQYIKEMNDIGISLEAPSLLKSEMDFSISEDKKHIYYGLAEIKNMSSFPLVYRSECLQEFVQENPTISQSTLLLLSSLGCFKTLWKGDKNQCTIKQANKWILENKPNYILLGSLKVSLNELKEKILATSDIKEKQTLLNSYNTKKEKYKTILNQLSINYTKDKEIPVETENKLLKYQTEKDLCNGILSAKDDIYLLKNGINDFSLLEKSKTPIIVSAIIVGISGEKKTKSSGKIYYNVDLMDKTGIIITRRFDSIPSTLIGDFRIPPEPYFNCKLVKNLEKTQNKTVFLTLKDTINALVENKINLEDIGTKKQVSINGCIKTLIESPEIKNQGEIEQCVEK